MYAGLRKREKESEPVTVRRKQRGVRRGGYVRTEETPGEGIGGTGGGGGVYFSDPVWFCVFDREYDAGLGGLTMLARKPLDVAALFPRVSKSNVVHSCYFPNPVFCLCGRWVHVCRLAS